MVVGLTVDFKRSTSIGICMDDSRFSLCSIFLGQGGAAVNLVFVSFFENGQAKSLRMRSSSETLREFVYTRETVFNNHPWY